MSLSGPLHSTGPHTRDGCLSEEENDTSAQQIICSFSSINEKSFVYLHDDSTQWEKTGVRAMLSPCIDLFCARRYVLKGKKRISCPPTENTAHCSNESRGNGENSAVRKIPDTDPFFLSISSLHRCHRKSDKYYSAPSIRWQML
ncbi:hypothetical protein Baya_11075 [Bagarius yarrelli]|uniref:Uncharacterized protein n=1 Tax=Bagarius yarrelli TaxID=175774 RepID=A0A556UZ27_BAGYA|nr:hypothetical protein Baya_11075 [Bagarius yarrelli]